MAYRRRYKKKRSYKRYGKKRFFKKTRKYFKRYVKKRFGLRKRSGPPTGPAQLAYKAMKKATKTGAVAFPVPNAGGDRVKHWFVCPSVRMSGEAIADKYSTSIGGGPKRVNCPWELTGQTMSNYGSPAMYHWYHARVVKCKIVITIYPRDQSVSTANQDGKVFDPTAPTFCAWRWCATATDPFTSGMPPSVYAMNDSSWKFFEVKNLHKPYHFTINWSSRHQFPYDISAHEFVIASGPNCTVPTEFVGLQVAVGNDSIHDGELYPTADWTYQCFYEIEQWERRPLSW